jgi:ATP-dependent DNA ligase
MLKAIMPKRDDYRLQFVDGIDARGDDFFRVVCERDLEGIVAKPKHGIYYADGVRTNWLKIRNPHYSQIDGRAELFDARARYSRRSPKAPEFVFPETRRKSGSANHALRSR